MTDENIAIVLNAMAEKIRMLTWEKESLQRRNDELVKQCEDMAKKYFEKD